MSFNPFYSCRPAWMAIFVVACLMLAAVALPARAAEDKSAGLFVNLSTIDAVPAGHALQLAAKMADRGHSVAVFLNGKAVWIATVGAPQPVYAPTGDDLQTLLKVLMKRGAAIIVCQVCAKVHGVGKEALIEGAVLGSPERVARYLFDPAYKILSW